MTLASEIVKVKECAQVSMRAATEELVCIIGVEFYEECRRSMFNHDLVRIFEYRTGQKLKSVLGCDAIVAYPGQCRIMFLRKL